MKGVYTATVTPFDKKGKIDFDSFEKILKAQLAGGVSGIVASGTTGEAATLSLEEKVELFKFVLEKCPEVDVVAGTGTNNTAESVRQTEAALAAGVTKVLIVTPYYNKPTAKGLLKHYGEIAKTGAKIILYNVPGRTGLNVSPEALSQLASIENIVAIKEATGDIGRFADYLDAVGTERFSFLSGDDFTVAPFVSMGGAGVISVISNILPELTVSLVEAGLEGDFKKAARIQVSINRINHAMFMESNPGPVKTALFLMGLCEDNFRAPLEKMEKENIQKLSKILKDYFLI
ncbi:MAG: 4-hydroxy-tetrahydrodipicolinate synthase [bacterium]